MTTEEIIVWKKNFPNILEKARSKANRHYPSILEIDDDAEFGEYDINEAKRERFIEGYLEAEKDLIEWVEEQLAILDKQTLLHPDDDVFWGQRNAYKQMKDKLNSLCATLKTR